MSDVEEAHELDPNLVYSPEQRVRSSNVLRLLERSHLEHLARGGEREAAPLPGRLRRAVRPARAHGPRRLVGVRYARGRNGDHQRLDNQRERLISGGAGGGLLQPSGRAV